MALHHVASDVANCVGNPATGCISLHLRYFFHFDKIVEDFKEQRIELQFLRNQVKYDIDEAIGQTEEIEKDVEDWLARVEKEWGEAQMLEDEIERNMCFNWCPRRGWRYCLSKKVAKETLYISELLAETCNFQRIGQRPPLPRLEFIPSKGFMPSESSNFAFKEIMEALKKDDVNMIGLYGMGGVGKTTLAQEVGNQAKQLFDKVVIVTVSQNPNINKIQDNIADFLDLDFQKKTIEGTAEQLRLRIKVEKSIFIILDDVWEELDLKIIGIPFGDDHKGCKIFLTTRLQQVCTRMNCQKKVHLNILSEDKAWALFKDIAGLKDVSPTLNDVAKEVSRECNGLPIAIVAMACALKGESLDGWIASNRRLKSSRHLDDLHVCVYPRLKLSYDYLDQDNIKQCFLLCSLFPEDYEISIELLIIFRIGQGLFNNNYLIEDLRKETCQALLKLQQSGLLLETNDEKFVKMHNVVRKLAHWITSREENMFMVKNGLKEWPSNGSFSCYMAISLWNNEIVNFPENMEFSNLNTLLLKGKNSLRVSCTFFERMPTLQVLLLQDAVFSLEALPFLKNLRTLCFIDCKLENIFLLKKMENLEIFVLLNTNIHELPEELLELRGLKSLYFSCIGPSNVPPNLLSRLTSLQELHVTNENNVNLLELNSLSRLTGLTLRVSTDQYFQENCVFPKLQSKNTVVEFENMEGLTSGTLRISDLFCKVKSLTLTDINMRRKNSFSRCLAQSVMHLEQLKISTFNKLDQVFAFAKEMVEQESLLPTLESILKEPTHASLQSLKDVTIQKCDGLKSIFSPWLAQSLMHLEQLDIQDCNSLEHFIIEAENSDEVVLDKDRSLGWPNLKSLEIAKCKSLKYVFPVTFAQGLPKLESLGITDCSQLMHVFDMAKKMDGHEAKEIDRDEAKEIDRHDIVLPQLTDLRLENLESLRSFCPKNYFVKFPSLKDRLQCRN